MRKFAILILHFFIAQSLLAQTFEKMFTAFPASMTIVESHDSTFLVGYHAENFLKYGADVLVVGGTLEVFNPKLAAAIVAVAAASLSRNPWLPFIGGMAALLGIRFLSGT
mgnify:CR=1 FL=1